MRNGWFRKVARFSRWRQSALSIRQARLPGFPVRIQTDCCTDQHKSLSGPEAHGGCLVPRYRRHSLPGSGLRCGWLKDNGQGASDRQ
jgi:hypothetical protein